MSAEALKEVISVASTIYSIISGIQKKQDTSQYRSEVLQYLTNIDTKLDSIRSQLGRIAADVKLNKVTSAEADIIVWCDRPEFQSWLQNSQGDDSSNDTVLKSDLVEHIFLHVRDYLTLLDDAITGKLPRTAPYLKLVSDTIDSPNGNTDNKVPIPTSKIDMLSKFLVGHLFQVQLKGLVLLAAAASTDPTKVSPDDVKTWKDALAQNFRKQLDVCVTIMEQDKEFNDNKWWGLNTRHVGSFQPSVGKVRLWNNTNEPLPENHVLVGFEFATDDKGYLLLKRYHGPLNKEDRATVDKSKVGTLYQMGSKKAAKVSDSGDVDMTTAKWFDPTMTKFRSDEVIDQRYENIPALLKPKYTDLHTYSSVPGKYLYLCDLDEGTSRMENNGLVAKTQTFSNDGSLKMDTPLTGARFFTLGQMSDDPDQTHGIVAAGKVDLRFQQLLANSDGGKAPSKLSTAALSATDFEEKKEEHAA